MNRRKKMKNKRIINKAIAKQKTEKETDADVKNVSRKMRKYYEKLDWKAKTRFNKILKVQGIDAALDFIETNG